MSTQTLGPKNRWKGKASTSHDTVTKPKHTSHNATHVGAHEAVQKKKKKNHIVAKVDVGWGNSVFLRGVGGGLNWDAGVPMTNLTDSQWVWSYPEENPPSEIKFLRNDADWAHGDNLVVLVEEVLWCEPKFP